MLFVLHCIDKPGNTTLRSRLRAPHLAYAQRQQHVFRFGGPLLDASGRPQGSLMILELADRAALDAHLQGDPFFAGELFASVSVWTTRQVLPETAPGALALELATAHTLAEAAAETT